MRWVVSDQLALAEVNGEWFISDRRSESLRSQHVRLGLSLLLLTCRGVELLDVVWNVTRALATMKRVQSMQLVVFLGRAVSQSNEFLLITVFISGKR